MQYNIEKQRALWTYIENIGKYRNVQKCMDKYKNMVVYRRWKYIDKYNKTE